MESKTNTADVSSENQLPRVAGDPIFHYTGQSGQVPVYDLGSFRKKSNIPSSELDSLMEALLVSGSASYDGVEYTLADGIGLSRQI